MVCSSQQIPSVQPLPRQPECGSHHSFSRGGPGTASYNGTEHLTYLPVATLKGGKTLRYVWDGHSIKPMDEELLRQGNTHAGQFQDLLQRLSFRLRDAFLPDPRDVTPDYWEWCRWRLTQRFFSSTMQNFSTQALLMALGMGARKSFAASAAINWLLKEGVGRIARMTVATNFGQTFDSDLKRMRFITSLIFTACMSGEFLTPIFPDYFVLLASIANIGRAVGLTAFVATQPAFQQALCTGGNLADLTSKSQAQHMLVDMMALGVAASLVYGFRNATDRARMLLPLCAFPLCAAGDLFSIYRELKAIQLKTINKERAEMITEAWVKQGLVPGAAEIAANENLLQPANVWGGALPLSITPLDRLVRQPSQLLPLLKRYSQDRYMLRLQLLGEGSGSGGSRSGGSGVSGISSALQDSQHPVRGTGGSSSSSSKAGGGGEPGASSGSSGGGGGSGGEASPKGGDLLTALSDVRQGLRMPWQAEPQPRILVSLCEGATSLDILTAVLEASYIRQALLVTSPHPAAHPASQNTTGGSSSSSSSSNPQTPCSGGSSGNSKQQGGSYGCSGSSSSSSGKTDSASRDEDGARQRGRGSEGSRQGSGAGTRDDGRGPNSSNGGGGGGGSGAHQQAVGVADGSGGEGFSAEGGGGALQIGWRKGAHPKPLLRPLQGRDLDLVMAECHRRAHQDAGRLMTAMSEGQWRVKPFMLSTMEKVMYVRLDTHSGSAASKTSPGSSSSSSSTAPVVREVQ
ncbi:MAG: hypothetical protein WDW36_008058 [Sanguina aurantia]